MILNHSKSGKISIIFIKTFLTSFFKSHKQKLRFYKITLLRYYHLLKSQSSKTRLWLVVNLSRVSKRKIKTIICQDLDWKDNNVHRGTFELRTKSTNHITHTSSKPLRTMEKIHEPRLRKSDTSRKYTSAEPYYHCSTVTYVLSV